MGRSEAEVYCITNRRWQTAVVLVCDDSDAGGGLMRKWQSCWYTRWYVISPEIRLFVDPGVDSLLVKADLLGLEPQVDLTLGRLDGIGTMNNISAGYQAEVTTNGTGFALQRVGGADHLATSKHDILALPNHGNYRG